MSKKFLIGAAAGAIAALIVSEVVKLINDEKMFSDEDLSEGNDLLDSANEFLLSAKRKSEKMIQEAEIKSDSILEHAAEILRSAKEKTSRIHTEEAKIAEEEIRKIKEEIESSIRKYENNTGS